MSITVTAEKPNRRPTAWLLWIRRLGIAFGVAAALIGGTYFYQCRILHNFHPVVDAQVYRSGRPSEDNLKEWTSRYGFKTIINLCGGSSIETEKACAANLGFKVVDLNCSSTHPPSEEWVRNLITTLETAKRPILIHCNAGADRSGVASVIAAMAVGGEDYATASHQLSYRYWHLDPYTNRIVALLEAYEDHCKDHGLSTAGWNQFRAWATKEYRDPSRKESLGGIDSRAITVTH